MPYISESNRASYTASNSFDRRLLSQVTNIVITSMETRRLLWFVTLVFSLTLVIRCFELPYGYFESSLLSFGKSRVTSQGSFLNRGASVGTSKNDLKSESTDMPFNGSSRAINHLNDSGSSSGFIVINHNSTVERSKSLGPEMALTWEKDPSSDDLIEAPNVAPMPIENYEKISPSTNSMGKDPANVLRKDEKPVLTKSANSKISVKNSHFSNGSHAKERAFEGPPSIVVPLSEMSDMLRQSRVSYQSMKPKWPSQVDEELLNARKLIESAQIMENNPHIDVNVYRNYSEFVRSYKLMEQTLKIYVYAEGEGPIFHQPDVGGLYGSEGWFMKQLKENKHFVTKNATEAHLFYLPFSSRSLVRKLYVRNSHSHKNLVEYLSRYLLNISAAHRFWNQTGGADHFLVACHDWAPVETRRVMKNCIRSLRNTEINTGGFQFGKDVSLPEIYLRRRADPLKDLGGKPPSQRDVLAFFAGNMHGYLRPILLSYWENKDPDMKIFGKLCETKGQMNKYIQYMKSSKYCISARGFAPYTPRVMEAIFYECVPVIISDNYVPPFFETLNWESFAVFVLEKDIPNLKNILLSISEDKYVEMQTRVRQVQEHFLWRNATVKYDVFHMILHSIWYTRIFQMTSG